MASGRKAYGIRSSRGDRYYLVTCSSCECTDFQRNGFSQARVGQPGEHRACKHILAVRLHCELVKAQQQSRASCRQRGHLSVVAANADRYAEIFERFEGD